MDEEELCRLINSQADTIAEQSLRIAQLEAQNRELEARESDRAKLRDLRAWGEIPPPYLGLHYLCFNMWDNKKPKQGRSRFKIKLEAANNSKSPRTEFSFPLTTPKRLLQNNLRGKFGDSALVAMAKKLILEGQGKSCFIGYLLQSGVKKAFHGTRAYPDYFIVYYPAPQLLILYTPDERIEAAQSSVLQNENPNSPIRAWYVNVV